MLLDHLQKLYLKVSQHIIIKCQACIRIRDFLLLISLADLQNRFIHYLIPFSDSLTHSVFLFYFLKVGQINLRCHGHDSRIGPCNLFVSIAIIGYAEIENLNFFRVYKTVKSIPDERIESQLNDTKKKK